jgi:hypothetical protein
MSFKMPLDGKRILDLKIEAKILVSELVLIESGKQGPEHETLVSWRNITQTYTRVHYAAMTQVRC